MDALSGKKSAIESAYNSNKAAIDSVGGNIMNKAWAADILRNTQDMLVKSNKNAAATAAVAGGSAEMVAAQKAAAANAMSQNIESLAKHANDNDMAIMSSTVNNNNNRASMLSAAYEADAQRSAALTNALISGIAGTAQTAAKAFI